MQAFFLSLVLATLTLFTLLQTGTASVCFSRPSAPPGASAYTEVECGPMPATGYPVGHQCSIPLDCLSPSLSQATCLDGVANNEGYWSQPVCTVSVAPGFAAEKTGGNVVTLAADVEYAALVHLPSITATTHFSMGFVSGSFFLPNSTVTVRIYTLQDPVGATAGPGDLIYTTTGSVVNSTGSGGLFVDQTTGVEINNTYVQSIDGGIITVKLPTPILFGNDFYISVAFGHAGLLVGMDCDDGASTQFWTKSGSTFVASTVDTYACVFNQVFVLSASSCQPTLLTATIGYGGGQNNFGQNEPSMPYLDFTRSGFNNANLELKFTYPFGVYDDIQFLPHSGSQVFGPAPAPVTGDPMTGIPPCGTTFQTIHVSSDNCQATATISANFIELIKLKSATPVCGWTKSISPVAYQGVFYTQYVGRIQVVTYQTVQDLGSVSTRIKQAYANVVVRAPIVTSNATMTPTSVTDAAVFQWTIVQQHLDTESLPYTSLTSVRTRTTAGYNVTAVASITSASSPSGWTFPGGLTTLEIPHTSPACTGAAVACDQDWALLVVNTDSGVCSLDAIVTIQYTTHCGEALLKGGGCDSNVNSRVFVTTVVLSSVDFCKVVGGVTSLNMDPPTLHVSSTSVGASTAALAMLPATPSVFVVGSSIGVHFRVRSNPAIPLQITSASARIYDANERSHFSLYSDVKQTASPYFYDAVNSNSDGSAHAFFNLPTGESGGVTYTPFLLLNSGAVNTIIVSVTASVSYDNILLGTGVHFVTFEVPLTVPPQRVAPQLSSAFSALANDLRSLPLSIQTGAITQETDVASIQTPQAASSTQALSTASIAGIAAGGAVAVFIIVAVAAAVLAKRAAASAYAAPAAAVVEVPASTGGSSISEGFYAPRVVVPGNV